MDELPYITMTISDEGGDPVFQPAKIGRIGVADAVDSNVLIYAHKERHLDEVCDLYPARHYVLIDDKIRILSRVKAYWGSRVTSVFAHQGHYAFEADLSQYPAPDLTIDRIGRLIDYDLAALLSAAQPKA